MTIAKRFFPETTQSGMKWPKNPNTGTEKRTANAQKHKERKGDGNGEHTRI
jgi:hypothetical protein